MCRDNNRLRFAWLALVATTGCLMAVQCGTNHTSPAPNPYYEQWKSQRSFFLATEFDESRQLFVISAERIAFLKDGLNCRVTECLLLVKPGDLKGISGGVEGYEKLRQTLEALRTKIEALSHRTFLSPIEAERSFSELNEAIGTYQSQFNTRPPFSEIWKAKFAGVCWSRDPNNPNRTTR